MCYVMRDAFCGACLFGLCFNSIKTLRLPIKRRVCGFKIITSPLIYVPFTLTVVKSLRTEKSLVAAEPGRSLPVTKGHI